jgi:hypothetical protein
MRSRVLAAALLVSPAVSANPLTVGAGVGITQSEVNANGDPDQALGLFGRVGLTRTLSGQLEVSRTNGQDPNLQTRSVAMVAVLDLGTNPEFVPILLAGAGLDHGDEQYGGVIDAHHVEAGVGLEYRSHGGFVLGAEVHIGERTVDSNSTIVPLACCTLYQPNSTLVDGQFRTARITLGLRF